MNKIIVANWKMNPSSFKEAVFIFSKILTFSKNIKNYKIIICPPFPFFSIFSKNKNVILGAQDIFYEQDGSYTGKVSLSMIKSLGAEYVILGHSETRELGDSNQIINKKILASLKKKIYPIVCFGEKERDSHGEYLSFIKNQLNECLFSIPKQQFKNIIIAYEPIWAIGKNAVRKASVDEFIEIRIFIKRLISDLYGIKIANSVKIIYGGSVSSLNARSFIFEGEADGLLIGRDSLIPKNFEEILKSIK